MLVVELPRDQASDALNHCWPIQARAARVALQVEGYGIFGDTLVFGRYPQGSLCHYDPSQPWEIGSNPAEPLVIGDEQSRPQAFVDLSDTMPGTVAVGSVPTGGRHGGAITLWEPAEGTHEVYHQVIEDQTPVSLVEHDGMLLGGTSIEGGYGIDPVTGEVTTLHGGGDEGDPVDAVNELARDRNGDLYVVGASTHLMRYSMPDDTIAPDVSATARSASPRNAVIVSLAAEDDTDDAPTVHVRVDDGEWSEYSRPVALRQGQTLEYRAIDESWNSSPVMNYRVDG